MLGQPTAPRLVGVGDRRPTTLLILSKTKTRLPLGRAGWRPASTARQPPATLILPPAGPEGNSVETDFRISHLKLSDGHRRLIPREDVEGLQEATPKQVAEMEILGKGTGLHWPALNLDHYVPRRSPRPRAFQRGTGNEGDGTLLRAEEDFCRLATSPLLRLSEPRSVGSGLPTETI